LTYTATSYAAAAGIHADYYPLKALPVSISIPTSDGVGVGDGDGDGVGGVGGGGGVSGFGFTLNDEFVDGIQGAPAFAAAATVLQYSLST
jgi:hypothetical protein